MTRHECLGLVHRPLSARRSRTAGRQPIYVRRLDEFLAERTGVAIAKVVREDEDHFRFGRATGGEAKRGARDKEQAQDVTRIFIGGEGLKSTVPQVRPTAKD